ncbi:V-type proton ATPase subunit d1-like isoform X4 [Phoenix dactylifera]|uniref:V-type proton ATPase subunit d1-like isoform X4 n=1 Tax=Phoenix dactylifera TaxID=42345 RepID=A0A8B8J3P7_PHODC|nr:V-type proton ATPase subunit d1-like isoform X4 [Phoenix dactylifera]
MRNPRRHQEAPLGNQVRPYLRNEFLLGVIGFQVHAAMEKYPPYQSVFSKISHGESQMLVKAFCEEEVKELCLAFEQQDLQAVCRDLDFYFWRPSFGI